MSTKKLVAIHNRISNEFFYIPYILYFLFVFTIFVYRIIFVLNGQFADRQLSVDDSVERDDGLGT